MDDVELRRLKALQDGHGLPRLQVTVQVDARDVQHANETLAVLSLRLALGGMGSPESSWIVVVP